MNKSSLSKFGGKHLSLKRDLGCPQSCPARPRVVAKGTLSKWSQGPDRKGGACPSQREPEVMMFSINTTTWSPAGSKTNDTQLSDHEIAILLADVYIYLKAPKKCF